MAHTYLRMDPDERLPKILMKMLVTIRMQRLVKHSNNTRNKHQKEKREQHTNRQNSSSDFQTNISV